MTEPADLGREPLPRNPKRVEQRFSATAVADTGAGAGLLHVKVVNATAESLLADLCVEASGYGSTAAHTVLAERPERGRPFEDAPARPHTGELDSLAAIDIPSYSFSVITLRREGS